MWKIISLITVCLLVSIGAGVFVYQVMNKPQPVKAIDTMSETKSFLGLTEVELALTPQQQQRGLMYRKSLCKTCGMLFEFDTERELNFWMRNTYIPLDIIFLAENGKITSISANAAPLQESPTFNSKSPAKYALEVNAGKAEQYKIAAGDYLDVSKLKSLGMEYRFEY
jgi:uncharacterized membrane protein (UPF0127 family)